MRALLLCALVACSAPQKAVGVPTHHESPAPTVPSGPAPRIEILGEHFEPTGLPAVGRDGAIVVVPIVDPDGGRGWPNLELQVRDSRDRLRETIPVMIANDYETLFIDGQPTADLNARVAAVNQKLAELHRFHDLIAMQPIALPARLQGTETQYPAKTVARCASENPAHIETVYQAPGVAPMVVRIRYAGTDTCWEPADELHVVGSEHN